MPRGNQTPFEQRFWSKVIKRGDDECWGWIGAKAQHPHTKSPDEKRWTCYLIKRNDTEQGEGVIYTNLKHSEVERAMHWLKVVRSGENQRRELYEYLEAQ